MLYIFKNQCCRTSDFSKKLKKTTIKDPVDYIYRSLCCSAVTKNFNVPSGIKIWESRAFSIVWGWRKVSTLNPSDMDIYCCAQFHVGTITKKLQWSLQSYAVIKCHWARLESNQLTSVKLHQLYTHGLTWSHISWPTLTQYCLPLWWLWCLVLVQWWI